jgi:hypothetical protein
MPAGLINIISVGANDLYLTGAPQITFFKMIYRRYTNFSKESVSIPVNNIKFGESTDIEIPKNSDLLGELYLQIQLPTINFSKEQINIQNPVKTITYLTAPVDYMNITNFMIYNTKAYRIALSDVNAIGVSTLTMVTDIINAFGTFDTNVYDSTLTSYYNTYLNNNNYYYGLLNPLQSNILTIANNILNVIYNNNNSPYTNNKVLDEIESAIQTSIKVQNYFYQNLLLYNKENAENLTDNAKFAWVDRLGFSMIDYIDLYIGGEKIERQYGDWLNVSYELSGNKDQSDMFNKMIGNVNVLTNFDRETKPAYLLTIPLTFWFCKNVGLSLPLIALQYNDVRITIKLKDLQDCAYIEKNNSNYDINLQDLWDDNNYILNSNILADYIYLDDIERKRFAVSAHECLIERVQDMIFDNINTETLSVDLDFRSPCKEIVWITQKNAYINNITNYYKSMWNNYGINNDGTGNPIISASLDFNGYNRFKVEGSYLNYLQPYAHHNNSTVDGINCYSFSLYPDEYQPSGTCNFSIISLASLKLKFDTNAFFYNMNDIDNSIPLPVNNNLLSFYPSVWKYPTVIDRTNMSSTTLRLRIFAKSYNIFRVIGGMGALAYY